jgi:RNA polymerase sigma-70 factor (ECF subfamily)
MRGVLAGWMSVSPGSDEPTHEHTPHAERPVDAGLVAPPVRPTAATVRGRFEALVGKHLDGLYGTALRLTRSRPAAEDLVQDAMLKAWRAFPTFHEGTNIRAWLYRILVNAHFDRHRKELRSPQLVHEEIDDTYLYAGARESAMLSEAGNPEVQVLHGIMDAEVRESLEALPLAFRAAVLLVDVEGFSYREAAEILGVPEGTVMSRLYRGRHALKRTLLEYARDRHYVRRDGA